MRPTSFLVGLATGVTLVGVGLQSPPTTSKGASDNAEVTRLVDADQADRKPANIDWMAVRPRDEARRKRILEIYAANGLRSANDWANAALVLQHGEGDDQLLAHEMCVVALAMGKSDAKWLAAASEDRWLDHIGRKQRFGTQYKGEATSPGKYVWRVVPMEDPGISDAHRVLMTGHTKAEVLKRLEEMNKGGESKRLSKP